MSRSTVLRHLRSTMTTPESKTLRRRVFDEETQGWRLEWTNSMYADSRVRWVNGNTISDRGRSTADRDRLRTQCLDEIETSLRSLGYVLKREHSVVLVLRRMGA